jgi:hypothetical protein
MVRQLLMQAAAAVVLVRVAVAVLVDQQTLQQGMVVLLVYLGKMRPLIVVAAVAVVDHQLPTAAQAATAS